MKRVLNIIERAVDEFEMKVDMSDSVEDVFCQALNVIDEKVDYDYISECESSNHHEHISWSDDKGFTYQADGQLLSGDYRNNTGLLHNSNSFRFLRLEPVFILLMGFCFPSSHLYVFIIIGFHVIVNRKFKIIQN